MPHSHRIALVAPNYHPRTCGVGDYSMRVSQELVRRGFEARVFTRQPAHRHPEAPEIPVLGAPDRGALRIAQYLASAIADWRPQEVWLQYTSQMFGASRFGSPALFWLSRRLRESKTRVQLVVHELFIPWSLRPDLALGALLQRAWLSALVSSADIVTVTTPSRLLQLQRLPVFAGRRAARVVPVGSNALPFPRRPSTEQFLIGVFSTLAEGKRLDVALEAFAQVAARIPRAHLLLIGDLGDERSANFQRFRETVLRHPASARIQLTGKLPLPEVAEQVASLDCFLFVMATGANTRSGTLPLALGTGIPVVATRGVESSDLFEHGRNLLFATSLSGQAFAEAVLRLHEDPELARRIGAGARRLFDEHLTWSRIVDGLLPP